MLNPDLQAAQPTALVNPASCANTAAATSAWVAVPAVEGDLVFCQHIGAVTGSITGVVNTADDGSGTNSAAVTFNEGAFTAVSSANSVQHRSVNRAALKKYVQYVGTVATGPALVAVSMAGRLKYA